MKLNRTDTMYDREARNKENENWATIENNFNNVVETVSDKAYGEVVDAAKLNWKEPVASFSNLPTTANTGDTVMARDTGKVYRYNGTEFKEIQEIDAGPVNEVDSRLTSQLAETEQKTFYQSLVNRKKQGKYITLIDDDGQRGVYTKFAPLLREYGIRMTSAVITNRGHGFPISGLPPHNSNYMSYEEMKEMESEGILEFVCHSHTHDLNYRYTDMSVSEIHEDMKKNKEIIRQLGWNYHTLVFPFGSINDTVTDVARQYFDNAFDIKGGVFQPPIDQYIMPRFGIDSKAFEDVKPVIDDAYEKDTWLVLMSHVDQYGGLNIATLRQIIEYAISKGFEFITVAEGVQRFGNLAQFGGDTIDFKGGIHGKDLGRLKIGGLDYMPNAPMTDFDASRMTTLKVRSFEADAYNLHRDTDLSGLYGNIFVYRDTENAFSYQTFISTNPSKRVELMRTWDNATSSWSVWVDVSGGIYYAGLTEFTKNAPVTAYPKGKVTRLKIRESDAASFGLTGFGELYIHRDVEDVYSYREYVDVKNNSKSRSVWNNASSAWRAFESNIKQLSNLSRTVTVTIDAHSTHDIPTDVSSISQNHNHIVIPVGSVPAGVIWSCYVPNDGRVTVRVGNVSNADITLTDVTFRILRTAQ